MSKFRLKFAFGHLVISMMVATLSALAIFYGWYKYPYDKILGVGSIYLILVIIDVICGPLLTLILASPSKLKRTLIFDISVIGIVQLLALLYGIYTLYEARPVMIVFEKDRFVLVQANDIQKDGMSNTPKEFVPFKFMGTRIASTREPKTKKELLNNIKKAINGVDVSLRPNWWVNYNQAKPSVINRVKNIATLIDKYPEQKGLIENKLSELNLPPEKAFYLPFVSSKNFEWTAILDDDANIIGYLNLSGF